MKRSHVVLAVWAALLTLFVLTSGAAGAQTVDQPADIAPGPDSQCPGAEVVDAFVGTGPKQRAPFEITGTRFRITIQNEATSQDPEVSGVSVFVDEAGGDPVTTFSQEGPGTDSSIVNAGPGQFIVETNPANSQYAIAIEDCVDTADGGGNPGGNPGTDPNRPGNDVGPNGPAIVPGEDSIDTCEELLAEFRDDSSNSSSGQYGAGIDFTDVRIRERVEVCLRDEVINTTIKGKKGLPDTGGVPLFGGAVLLLAGSLAGVRLLIRRD